MSDAWAVALAVAAATGAWASRPVPVPVAIAVVVGAFAVRRPAVLCVGAALLASAMGARAWDGASPLARQPYAGTGTLIGDPELVRGSQRAVLELRLPDGRTRRVEAWARGAAANVLRHRLAGERVMVRGALRPVSRASRERLARRHVVARLAVGRLEPLDRGGLPARAANGFRRLLVRGAASLPDDRRALFTGLVLGDERGRSDATASDFEAAGLTHLLAVSGGNVAFVLALATPARALLGLKGRFVTGIAVLLAFGLLTRWEPSVLRAAAMAAVAMTGVLLGRPAPAPRALALAVTALVLVDPMLVGVTGFQLSVGASAGLVVLARPLARVLRGPRGLRDALAVTVAAQAGAAPVLVTVFDGLPVASLPANVLAVPAAGPVMVWGLLAGPVAGLTGGAAAEALHLPTRLLVEWIAWVARTAAGLPLGTLQLPHLAAAAALGVVGFHLRGWWRSVAVVGVAATLAVPAVALAVDARRTTTGVDLDGGGTLWRDGRATVLVAGGGAGVDARRLLSSLRRQGVGRLDVVVARRGASPLAEVLARHPARVLVEPPIAGPQVIVVGRLSVAIVAHGPGIDAAVSRCDAGGPCSGITLRARARSP